MSVTTSTGTKLTRAQSNQMPALLEFYSPSSALLEARERGPARGVIWSVATLFGACALAAGLIPIDKVVTAAGKVTATEDTIVVQPLEQSIVRAIYVQEGQTVHKGDLLAKLDPTFSNSDRTALRQSVESLRAEVERLRAEAAGVDYVPTETNASSAVQMSIFQQRKSERNSRMENYRQKIDGLQATLAKAAGDINSYSERLKVAQTVEGKRRELAQLGWGSQLNQLQAQDTRLDMQRGLEEAQHTAKAAQGDLQAMRAEAAAYDQDWHAKALQDETDANRKLDEAAGNFAKADLRSHLVEFRAETDATVLTKARVSVGSVLQSGDPLLTLVPKGAPVEVEARVAGSDAGFVHVGNKVSVKFDTFPFVHYGMAHGTVRVVSPDSFSSPQNEQPTRNMTQQPPQNDTTQSYYRVKIALDSIDLHDTPPGFAVTPGMPVTADVMVGKRTALSYIFSRALPVAYDGMREP
jgi:HlyD family secretion protein